jgi:hypothetical protein
MAAVSTTDQVTVADERNILLRRLSSPIVQGLVLAVVLLPGSLVEATRLTSLGTKPQ